MRFNFVKIFIVFVALISGIISVNANPATNIQATKNTNSTQESTQTTKSNKPPKESTNNDTKKDSPNATKNPKKSQQNPAKPSQNPNQNPNPQNNDTQTESNQKNASAKKDIKSQEKDAIKAQKKAQNLAKKEVKKQAKIEAKKAKLQAKKDRNAPPKNLHKRVLQQALSFSPFYVGVLSLLDTSELDKIAQSNPKKIRIKEANLGVKLEQECEGSEVDFTCVNPKEIEIFSPHIKLSQISQHFRLFPDTLQVALSANVSAEFFLDSLPFHTDSQRGEFEKIIPKYFKDILTIKKEGASVSYDYRVDFASEQGSTLVLVLQGSANNPFYEHKSLAEFLLDFMLSAVPKSIDYKDLCQNLSHTECARNITRKKAQFSITLFSPKNLKVTLTSQDFSDTMYAIYAIDVANKARASDRETYKKDIQSIITKESQILRKNLINDKMPINTHNFALDFLSAFGGFFLDSERLGFEISAKSGSKETLLLRDFFEDSGRLRDFVSSLQFGVIR
ncbi:hypothetical protein [Helicobacter sp. T3_23-1059]